MFHGGYGFGWFGMLFGGLMMVLFWIVVIALAVLAVRALLRWSSRQSGSMTSTSVAGATGDKALAILKERYAKGEINKEEYENMRRDLSA